MIEAPLSEGFPLPRPSSESAAFWQGCREGRLRLQRCDACQRFWFPPAVLCPHCWSESWSWHTVGGRARIHSFVVFHRPYHHAFAEHLPYVVAVVELEEGPRLPTLLLDAVPDEVAVGDVVEVCFVAARDGLQLPWFRKV